MFKTIAATMVAATATATVNADFFSGLQTGAFIGNEDHFLDYSCPAPETSEKIDNFVNMYNMAKSMMGGSKSKGKKGDKSVAPTEGPEAMFNKIDKYIDEISVLMSVMDEAYEGGDFCQGLTVGYEGRNIIKAVVINGFQSFVSNMNDNKRHDDN